MDVMASLVEHGVLLESAKGPIANVAQMIAGEPIRGSWWGHPAGHDIYDALQVLDDSPDVVRLRLVRGKVTLVHRRVWPALVALSDSFTPAQLAALVEEHTPSGRHRVHEQAYPDWVPDEARRAGAALSIEDAQAMLPECLR
jgi:hypothetical protein